MLRFAPAVALLALAGPVLAGLSGAALPAFGYFPALGAEDFSLTPWRSLLATPGIFVAALLSVWVGLAATALSVVIVFAVLARFHGGWAFVLMRRLLSPLLAVPHVAVAIGLAFVLSPSGLVFRLASAALGGPAEPPDLLIVHDRLGLTLIGALVLKEVPFLFLMCLAALPQTDSGRAMTVARSLGYAPSTGWIKTVLPRLYPQVRLPVLAVLAYSLSVVDVAMILGPTTPPSLPVLILKWMNDPALDKRFVASAGAVLMLALTAVVIMIWLAGERAAAHWGLLAIRSGGRRTGRLLIGGIAVISGATVLVFVLLSAASIGLWAFADSWRFPEPWPQSLSLDHWYRYRRQLATPLANAAVIGAASSLVALLVTIMLLERDVRFGRSRQGWLLGLIYLPLIVPQIAFLPGLQILFIAQRLDGHIAAVMLAHLVFVLPYVYLSLADPWGHFDERYRKTALALGASPARALMRVRLPILLAAVLTAFAVGFAVSIGQYLPTLMLGAGRLPTITTEAVALASGGDRRLAAMLALLQALLPFLAFMLALAVPATLYRHRRSLRTA